ncbi:CDP-glycerol glycerophosphotransferase family protein [Pantoea agglomerans]|uniref:CDP-glycerol glycerophosphotransferase family protein n=1 Tax=Enterobacter agglomerans TaxID=549 RepID=A0ACC5RJ00_ENTAG|nr:CDP-glycerol glycerophosphotransferase family protein [Pantoea agglomerans]MBK4724664.1 CDP-glycerol glycerophosphotransferase family protein [Pantoea agglomerans]
MTHCPTIGFYMETAFHYDVYKNIIFALQKQGHSCTLVIADVCEKAFVLDMAAQIKTLRHDNLGVMLLSKMRAQRIVLETMVSPYYTPLLNGTARWHVRAMYGLAKDRWGHAWWNAFYDLILCYGNHSQEKLNIAGSAVTVGNPRFDDWHNRGYNRQLVNALTRNQSKPIVLYAPTFGDLSSIPHWAERLNTLQQSCTLLVKLHHGTRLNPSEAASLQMMEKYFRKSIVNSLSSFALLDAADRVLTDNSGFIFDAIHAGKRTVLLEWAGLEDVLQGSETFSDTSSAEQTARQYIDTASSLTELQTLLSADPPSSHPGIEAFRTHYCDRYQDGQAGCRAATAITQLMATPANAPKNFYLESLREKLFTSSPGCGSLQ